MKSSAMNRGMSSKSLFCIILILFASSQSDGRSIPKEVKEEEYEYAPTVNIRLEDRYVIMDNGLVEVTLTNPEGQVAGIRYGGLQNVLNYHAKPGRQGYWDITMTAVMPDGSKISGQRQLKGTGFKIINRELDQVEISFYSRLIDPSLPLKFDLRYVMQSGVSGFYTYAILEHGGGMGALKIGEIRTVYKPLPQVFDYMAITDKIQRVMPTNLDRNYGTPLAYKEAVLLPNGEVDDKYLYSLESKDIKVHGWISNEYKIGFWHITASNEFRSAGPFKQELSSHAGPTTLTSFYSDHYGGLDLKMRFEEGETWKKVLGPVLIHLNSVSNTEDPLKLWDMAKDQMEKEVKSWPYDFPMSEDYLNASQRGSVKGQLQVDDNYNLTYVPPVPATSAWVGLAPPGSDICSYYSRVCGWQSDTKGYQFWTQADEQGKFKINGVRPGVYNLVAWVPGYIGQYRYETEIIIEQGKEVNLVDNNLVFKPRRFGWTLWEIGVPDRSAAEFYIPDPEPNLVNRLFLNDDENKYRQYGLWSKYDELHPDGDPLYTIGWSNYTTDWFFAHVVRVKGDGNSTQIIPTAKHISFNLDGDIMPWYTLQIAVASSTYSRIVIRVNDPYGMGNPLGMVNMFGRDNAIARHGIHGLYWLFSLRINHWNLRRGENIISLIQPVVDGPFNGLMYDYIRLESPGVRYN